jgi:hypothetical protein
MSILYRFLLQQLIIMHVFEKFCVVMELEESLLSLQSTLLLQLDCTLDQVKTLTQLVL